MNTQQDLPGKSAAQRIETALRKMHFSDPEIARILIDFDMAIQKDLGQELLNSLPEDKRKEFERSMEEGKDPREFAHFFNISQEEVRKRLEERCNEIADELEEWQRKIKEGDRLIKKEIAEKFLGKIQSPKSAA